jgi:membrane peptidoglycan carboxypeptidase
MFVVVAALTGTLVAGLVIPFAGMVGLTTRSVTDAFQNMNGDLEDPPLPVRSRLLAADGSLIATFYERNRVQVKLDRIAPVMQRAILAIEDARFYHHGPLDAQGTLRAFIRNRQGGGVSQGGSSITQQYVKLVLFENAPTREEQNRVIEDSYGRKLQELRYAVELEKQMTKDEILERYLNIVYFGDGVYGVQAAARHFFNTTADKLSLKQAAMLAGLVRDPNGLDPRLNPDAVFNRRNLVLARMAHEGMITEEESTRWRKSGLGLRMVVTESGCYTSPYPFFCDYAREMLLADPALGRTTEDRQRLLNRGGLTIRTTLDPKAQKAAERAVLDTAYTTDPAVAAVSMVEPGTGRIKAMAQSRKYGKGKGRTYVNFNVPKRYNGGIGFSPGSTFKTMVMAAAIRQGIPLSANFPSPQETVITQPIRNCPGGKPGHHSKAWPVRNSTESGPVSNMLSGTARSVNTFYANLEVKTGICEPADIATKLGATRGDGEPLEQYKPFVLGSNEVAPLSMAEAYASFAARGVHCRATPLRYVLDRDRNPIRIRGPECAQAIPKEVADTVNFVLRQVVDGADPGRTGQRMSMKDEGRQVAGKTGTDENRRAVWFLGHTTNMAAAAVVADNHKKIQTLLGQSIHGEVVTENNVWGGTLAGPIWLASIKGALGSKKSPNFVEPSAKMIQGLPAPVPSVVGKWQREARPILKDAGFSLVVDGEVASNLPKGMIAVQNPPENSQAPMGSTVIVKLSNGQPPKPKPTPKPREPGPTKPPDRGPLPPPNQD